MNDQEKEIRALKEHITKLENKVASLESEVQELVSEIEKLEHELSHCDDTGMRRLEIEPFFPDEYTLYEVLPPRVRDFQWALDEVKRFAETLR